MAALGFLEQQPGRQQPATALRAAQNPVVCTLLRYDDPAPPQAAASGAAGQQAGREADLWASTNMRLSSVSRLAIIAGNTSTHGFIRLVDALLAKGSAAGSAASATARRAASSRPAAASGGHRCPPRQRPPAMLPQTVGWAAHTVTLMLAAMAGNRTTRRGRGARSRC